MLEKTCAYLLIAFFGSGVISLAVILWIGSRSLT